MRPQEVRRSFDRAARERGFVLDEAQEHAVERLSGLAAGLARPRRARARPRGLYLWGPVGRGKSWLVDVFFESVPTRAKRRVHFHDFFRQLHEAVHRHRDERSAIDGAVSELLAGCRLLCFDEFHAHDVGDAMLVARLLRELFARRIVLVTTSNYRPDALLPNPLYHHLFQPGIDLILAEMDVVEVAGLVDYRHAGGPGDSRRGFSRGAYVRPGHAAQLSRLGLTPPDAGERRAVRVGSRVFPVRALRWDLVWFAFDDLCERPTSALDVLVLADRFSIWVVDGVPPLAACSPDARQRLVDLVDVLCDRDVTLFLVGGDPLTEVLAGRDLPVDIGRTVSRLSLLRRIG